MPISWASLSRKSEVEVLDALKILSSPDTKRVSPQPHDGRRIQAVENGWLILNGEFYRAMVRKEMKRQRNMRAQQAYGSDRCSPDHREWMANQPMSRMTRTLAARKLIKFTTGMRKLRKMMVLFRDSNPRIILLLWSWPQNEHCDVSARSLASRFILNRVPPHVTQVAGHYWIRWP